MMYIDVNKYDKRYPYTISDAWGGKVYMTEEGLKKLQEEIKKVLDKNRQKHDTIKKNKGEHTK